MKKIKIAVLPGDGIGPEIVSQAVKAVDAAAARFGYEPHYTHALVGAAAIYAAGDPYPESTHKACMEADAVLFGAIGDPRFDNAPDAKVRPEQGLLAMRKKLGLYANLRPVTTFASLLHRSPLRADLVEGADFLCVRELTGGLYFGRPQGRSEDGDTAYDTCVYTRAEVERICRLGFEYASKRRGKLTIVDKANVLATSRLWRETAQRLAAEYHSVETEFMFVDNAAMKIIQQPRHFDVIVTENMFGDILTDEASVITGSLGLLPSASIGTGTSEHSQPRRHDTLGGDDVRVRLLRHGGRCRNTPRRRCLHKCRLHHRGHSRGRRHATLYHRSGRLHRPTHSRRRVNIHAKHYPQR